MARKKNKNSLKGKAKTNKNTQQYLTFDFENFAAGDDSYKKTEETIEKIRKAPNILSYTHPRSKVEYLFNVKHKIALVLKSVAKVTDKMKKKRKSKFPHDFAKRVITTQSGYNAVKDFYRNSEFKGYELIVPSGDNVHEVCLFFREYPERGYDTIFFNPNYSEIQDGVQTNKVAKAFTKHFGRTIHRQRAYHSSDGNVGSNCSAATWEQIFNAICNGSSPFENPLIELHSFDHHMMEKTYHEYHNLGITLKLKNGALWEKCDELLMDATEEEIAEIWSEIKLLIVRKMAKM